MLKLVGRKDCMRIEENISPLSCPFSDDRMCVGQTVSFNMMEGSSTRQIHENTCNKCPKSSGKKIHLFISCMKLCQCWQLTPEFYPTLNRLGKQLIKSITKSHFVQLITLKSLYQPVLIFFLIPYSEQTVRGVCRITQALSES